MIRPLVIENTNSETKSIDDYKKKKSTVKREKNKGKGKDKYKTDSP